MQYKRADRVGDLIREVIGEMLLRELSDPRLEAVTVTGVELTDDLKTATIFFSARGDETREAASLQGLQRAAGFIKKKLGRELRLRYVPDLIFKVDHSFEYGSRIDRLIQGLKNGEGEDPSKDH